MSLRDQLQTIYEEHGRLTPKLVVDTARDDQHPLHSRFEWDDAVAGEKYRQQQAHSLIQSVKVVRREPDGTNRETRAFPAIRRETGYSYEPVEKVLQDPLTTRMLLQDMEREWRQLKRRYDQFEEFRTMVIRDIDEAA